MKRVAPSPEGIAEAAAVIRAGGIVAYPTETLYGLGADPFSAPAIRRLFAAKGRAETNPVLLIAADAAQVAQVVREISAVAQRYMDAFWPGPLSLVLPKHKDVPAELCGGTDKVCVRVTASEIARALCIAVGHPITSTSANRSGDAPSAHFEQQDLTGVDLYIDAGPLAASTPSTVYDPDEGIIYRHGAISEAALRLK
ncbi:MAG: L-threonylcarbamoyladenylate synthase [Candidatus Hydrogenedentes bacterium]|nr:L-threonylcarbamoyladenylate synthase [Candidatus Hydrogenedentota bacterium]